MLVTKTKFEILMNIEVADVNDVPENMDSICDRISKAIENIYFVNPIDIKSIHVSRTGRVKTGITPKLTFIPK